MEGDSISSPVGVSSAGWRWVRPPPLAGQGSEKIEIAVAAFGSVVCRSDHGIGRQQVGTQSLNYFSKTQSDTVVVTDAVPAGCPVDDLIGGQTVATENIIRSADVVCVNIPWSDASTAPVVARGTVGSLAVGSKLNMDPPTTVVSAFLLTGSIPVVSATMPSHYFETAGCGGHLTEVGRNANFCEVVPGATSESNVNCLHSDFSCRCRRSHI